MSYYEENLAQVLSDPMQKKAYDTEDSTVVIAGPGSGKTTILTLKIMKLLNGYIKEPRGLACLTYSREAAREFEDRLKKLGFNKRKNVFLGTVHSFCLSEILSNFAHLYDYNLPKPLKIMPEKLGKKIYKEVLSDLNLNKFSKVTMNKERMLTINGVSEIEIESNSLARKIADEYEKRVLEAGYIDYESIIIYSTRLIQEQEYVRKCLSAKFPWIIIDEYQDLGRPLHEMVLSLFTQTDIKIFAVGDPDQSIYGFSGAMPDYLVELYDREDTISVELKNNYRSNQDIIDGSEIVLNMDRNYNAMTREGEEAVYEFISCENGYEEQFKYLFQSIIPECQKQGIPLDEVAVLLGFQDDCKALALECMKNDIPYYIPKHSFERTDFVQWVERCAKWTYDRNGESFDELFGYWRDVHLLHCDNKYLSEKELLNMKKRFLSCLIASRDKKDNIKDWLWYFFEELKIGSLLKDSEQMPDELDNLKCLCIEVKGDKYKGYDINKFSKIGKPENQITITTRHSSKGLEFEVVVMMGMDENHFPSWRVEKDPKAIYEENRLCFVCISRAKRVCILMHSKHYVEWHHTRKEYISKQYMPSRYIGQLKENIEKHRS